MQFFKSSFHLLPLRFKFPSYHPVVQHTNSVLHLSLCTIFLHKCDLYLFTIIT
jgi:hypothetical protein